MTNNARTMRAVCVLLACAVPALSRGQGVDTVQTDTVADRLGLWARTSRASGLVLTSGKTYNRVEGLPVYIGPVFHDSAGAADLNASVMGIIRSADTFDWDSQNLGHRIAAEMRVGRGRGYGLGAFFWHRDFRDHFNRHGAKATATFNMSARSSFSADWSDERWSSARARSVFSIFGNGKTWRANPLVDAGRFHLGVLRANIDTRNDEYNPSTGWLILAEYERGTGRLVDVGPTSPLARPTVSPQVTYGRVLVDLRRYNRLSPTTWVNARFVLGGWLNGDDLPLERRFSVGGVGTVPGFDFRKYEPGTVDVSQCSNGGAPPPGNPAQCERVALAQLEYRNELHSSLFDFLNARPIRLRGIGFTVQPTVVAFVDAGRGWLVGQPSAAQ